MSQCRIACSCVNDLVYSCRFEIVMCLKRVVSADVELSYRNRNRNRNKRNGRCRKDAPEPRFRMRPRRAPLPLRSLAPVGGSLFNFPPESRRRCQVSSPVVLGPACRARHSVVPFLRHFHPFPIIDSRSLPEHAHLHRHQTAEEPGVALAATHDLFRWRAGVHQNPLMISLSIQPLMSVCRRR